MNRDDINAELMGYKCENKKIFLQIDGLPYEILLKALKKNYMPALKKMLKKGYRLHEVYSELPSNTPAAQMKIMYGLKDKIRAFRWYDKRRNEHYTFKTPHTADYWEKIAEVEGDEPLLQNGASYINLYSGGAARSIMTLSKTLDTNLKKRLNSNEVWRFIFLNADFITVMIYRLGREFFTELYEYLKYKIKKLPQRDETFFPYVRIGNSVFFRDISVMGSTLEMNEGTEKIYVTFMAFDELGHQRGPETKEALKTLKGIDTAIKKLYKKGRGKGYNFYIFSDHGHTTTIPFHVKYGISLKELILSLVNKEIAVGEYNTKQENTEFLMFYLLRKAFKGIVVIGSGFFNFFARIIRYMFIKGKRKIIEEKSAESIDVIVTNSGPLSHIYFKNIENRMTFEEITLQFGDVADKILLHEGIEFGIVKCNVGYLIKGKYGSITVNENFEIIEKKEEVFKNIEYYDEKIVDSLREIADGEDSGDIILFGAILDNKIIINFENQYGGHGGIGGMQNSAFLISQDNIEEKELGISDLYDIFMRENQKI